MVLKIKELPIVALDGKYEQEPSLDIISNDSLDVLAGDALSELNELDYAKASFFSLKTLNISLTVVFSLAIVAEVIYIVIPIVKKKTKKQCEGDISEKV